MSQGVFYAQGMFCKLGHRLLYFMSHGHLSDAVPM